MEVLYNVILLTPNNHLQKAMRLYENEMIGPESILVDGGTVQCNIINPKQSSPEGNETV